MEKLIIIGLGEVSRDVTQFVKRYNLYEIVGYACSREYYDENKKRMPDVPLYITDELGKYFGKDEIKLFVAISHWQSLNKERRIVFEKLKLEGWSFAKLISPNSIIYPEEIGEGSWIADNVFIGNEVIIGENVFIGTGAFIGHYSIIKNHVQISGQSSIMGSVLIKEQCFIGVRSILFNGITIGEKCIVGGATVIKIDMPDSTIAKTPDNFTQYTTYPDGQTELIWKTTAKIKGSIIKKRSE